jgi:heme A synthase
VDVVETLHRFVGYSIPAGFAALALWALFSLVRNREPSPHFWNLLAALQVIVAVQFLVGGTMFVAGRRPASNGPTWLHYVYGAFFPALVLVVAHSWARRARAAPWLVFGFAGLICFGLTFRALQTGLGIG